MNLDLIPKYALINQDWYMDDNYEVCSTCNSLTQFTSFCAEGALEKISVFYEPRDTSFIPILFLDKQVTSCETHDARSFYLGVLTLINLEAVYCPDGDYDISISNNGLYLDKRGHLQWGCRMFTLKQLKQIKILMEWHYPKIKKGIL